MSTCFCLFVVTVEWRSSPTPLLGYQECLVGIWEEKEVYYVCPCWCWWLHEAIWVVQNTCSNNVKPQLWAAGCVQPSFIWRFACVLRYNMHNNEMPPIKLRVDCLIVRYDLPVVYYVAGWTLYSVSKASTIVTDNKRPLYFTWALQTIHEQQILQIFQCLLWRGRNGKCWSITHTIILTLCVFF